MRKSSFTGLIAFFSVSELGWRTWAARLHRYGDSTGARVVHVSLATPKWLRYLSRPLPFPFCRSLISQKGYFTRTIDRHLDRLQEAHPLNVLVASSQWVVPYVLDACRRNGIKLVVCLDTTGPIHVRDLLREPPLPDSTWEEERRVYDSASLIVPWSNWARQSLLQDFGVDPAKVLLTPPAVRLDIAPLVKPTNRLPRIVFVGNDWGRKGGARLLAWHQRHFATRAELHIASAKAPRIKAPNVVCHGSVPQEKLLNQLLPAMDIFCLPTSHDMSPFAIAEAQAAGLPVVSSCLAGIPDLVADNISGFVCDPGDDAGFVAAIDRLVTDVELRINMSRAARAHAEEFLDADVVFPRLMHRIAALARPESDPSSQTHVIRS